MSEMEARAVRGSWALPQSPDRACRGALEYSPGSGIRFEAEGDALKADLVEQSEIPVIHGLTDKGKAVTLLRVIPTGISQGGAVAVSRFHAHALLEGGHFAADGVFHSMRVFLSGLDDWLLITGFEVEPPLGDLRACTVSYRVPDPIPLCHDSSCRLSFGFGFDLTCRTHPHTFVGLTQAANIIIEPTAPRQLDWFMGELIMMQRFVALATLTNVLPHKVSLYSSDRDDPDRSQDATLFYQPIGEIQPKNWFRIRCFSGFLRNANAFQQW